MTIGIEDFISRSIIDNINAGIIVIDLSYDILFCNSFVVKYSSIAKEEMLGKNLFDIFPYLPKAWLELKFRSVQILKSYSFVSWKQRSYLFKFRHNRPITGDVDYMYQDCTFLPVLDVNAQTNSICIIVQDMTDIAISQKMINEVLDANKMLKQLSYYDGLTNIYNRLYIENLLEKEFDKSSSTGSVLSVVMFDLDHFKRINDTYGHLAGDEVLRCIAKTVGSNIRQIDMFGRYGGEEFLLIMPDTHNNDCTLFCQQIRTSVQDMAINFDNIVIKVTLSMGVTRYRQGMKDYLQLIHEADIALYQSKKEGRNRVTTFSNG